MTWQNFAPETSKDTHTPGPWKYGGHPSGKVTVTAGDKRIAHVTAEDAPAKWANARLIAAAPDLLEALQALADEADAIGNALSARGQGATVLGMRVHAARAAIAKARGE